MLWGASAPCWCLANPHSPQASQLGVYKAFVDNYKIALETAEKCSQSNYQFQKISEVSWDGAVPAGQGCVPAQGREHCPCDCELTVSAPWRCSPCPGDLQGLSPRAGPQGALLEGRSLLGIAGGCPHFVQAQVGLSLCCYQCWAPVAHLLLPGAPCLDPLQKLGPPWLQPGLSGPVQLGGISTMSQLLGTARAAPSQEEPTLLHPAPVCGLQHGQAGARGCRKGWGDPMTLSHDLPPTPAPADCADGAFPP